MIYTFDSFLICICNFWMKSNYSSNLFSVNSTEIDQKGKIPDDFLQSLKDLGLFGRMIPAKYGKYYLKTFSSKTGMEFVYQVIF